MVERYVATIHTVTVSQFRQRLASYIGCVRYGDDFVRIKRRGEDPVYLISEVDFKLMEKTRIDYDVGPKDPVSKGRFGGIMEYMRKRAKQRRLAREAGEDVEDW